MGPDDFFYELQENSIAQDPLEERTSAKMLVDLGQGSEHLQIREFPNLLKPGDVVVVNNTRVLPGRLFLKKRTGGTVEILFCLLYTSPSPRDATLSRMPSCA